MKKAYLSSLIALLVAAPAALAGKAGAGSFEDPVNYDSVSFSSGTLYEIMEVLSNVDANGQLVVRAIDGDGNISTLRIRRDSIERSGKHLFFRASVQDL